MANRAAKKKTPARSAAPKKAAATRSGSPRLAAVDGKVIEKDQAPAPAPVVKLSKADRLAADVRALTSPEAIDTSFVITDYDELRAKLIEAMGDEGLPRVTDFAQLLETARRRKINTATHVFVVHPLTLHVMPGLNSRGFLTQERIERVAKMTDMCEGGINTPLKCFYQGDKLFIEAGETRWRAVAHNWILKATDPTRKAPIGIPLLLQPAGMNDAKTHLNVAMDNEQDPLKPIEVAQKYFDAYRCGMDYEAIAKYLGKKGQAGVTHVESYIGMLEMPEAVLNVIRSGLIAMTLAFQWWKEEGKDAAKTMARIKAAEKVMVAKGATHVMPKHDEAAAAGETEGSTERTPTTRTTTRKSTAPEGAVKTLDMIASVPPESFTDEDGFGIITIRRRIEEIVEMHQRLGWEVPKKYQAAA